MTSKLKTESPTPVGMNRNKIMAGAPTGGVSHACGDEPTIKTGSLHRSLSLPRMWG